MICVYMPILPARQARIVLIYIRESFNTRAKTFQSEIKQVYKELMNYRGLGTNNNFLKNVSYYACNEYVTIHKIMIFLGAFRCSSVPKTG